MVELTMGPVLTVSRSSPIPTLPAMRRLLEALFILLAALGAAAIFIP
jgi:hypothetical protein